MSFPRVALLGLCTVAALAGCKSGPLKCSGNSDYLRAESIAPITNAGGKLQEAPSALKVPDVTPAAREAAKQPILASNKRAACLDYPPSLMVPDPSVAPAPAAAAPVAPAPAAASPAPNQ